MKPKSWNKRRRGRINVTRGTRRATMGRRSRYWVDTRNDYWNPNLIQHWSIPFSMLSPMDVWALNMTSIRSIGWRTRTVYLSLCLIGKYRISWFCTCKVRLVHGIWVAILWSWKNHGLKNIWRPFRLFFTCIYCIFIVNSQRMCWITSPWASTACRRSTRSTEIMSSTPRITKLYRYC